MADCPILRITQSNNAAKDTTGQSEHADDKSRGQETSQSADQKSSDHTKEGAEEAGSENQKGDQVGPSTSEHHGPHGVQAEIDKEIEKSGKHFDAPTPAEAPKEEEGDAKKGGNQPAPPPADS